jgi:peptidoglycan hydrolase-like protein with peptidoglycan-binding domain
MEVGADPIPEPTVEPTPDLTVEPTPEPTPDPTPDPTPEPTVELTPTAKPRTAPTDAPPAPSVVPDASRTGSGAIPAPESVGSTAAAAVTLTSIAALGTVVETGTVLYGAAGEPVVAVRADTGSDAVFWRDLTIGVDDGADVRTLEEALAFLGYGDGLTVDETFTSVTAAAVERWERDLGRLDPDGVVELGDLVVVLDEAEVDARLVELGATLRTGTTVLTLASASQVVTARVDAARLAEWPVGGPVTLEWSDGAPTAAHVVATGRDVVDATVEVVVGIDAEVPGRATGTPVTVVRTADRREGALTVPVAAIVQGQDGRPGVVVLAGDDRRPVPVAVGVVSGGWVEVSGDLAVGELVVMPG